MRSFFVFFRNESVESLTGAVIVIERTSVGSTLDFQYCGRGRARHRAGAWNRAAVSPSPRFGPGTFKRGSLSASRSAGLPHRDDIRKRYEQVDAAGEQPQPAGRTTGTGHQLAIVEPVAIAQRHRHFVAFKVFDGHGSDHRTSSSMRRGALLQDHPPPVS